MWVCLRMHVCTPSAAYVTAYTHIHSGVAQLEVGMKVYSCIAQSECFLALSALRCNPWNFVPPHIVICCGGCAQHTPLAPN